MSDIRLDGVRKSFGAVDVIKGVDLNIASGEFAVFVGPSGCGKSTLLRMICGLEGVTAGAIGIDGRNVTRLPPGEREVAMVFQSYALYPHMSVEENLSFGLRMTGTPADEIARRVAEAARILQIEPLLQRRPKQLSGGQRQRAAIGRAIVRKPKVFLFDEPLSNLDAALRVQMRVEIARLHSEIGATMIYVTHDQIEAMTLADRIVVLNRGVVEQVGAPLELYEAPRNRFVAGFLGQPTMNFLDGTVTAADNGATIRLVGDTLVKVPNLEGAPAGSTMALGIRPDAIALAEPGSGTLAGTVAVVEHLGGATLVHVTVDGIADLIMVEMRGHGTVRAGDRVALAIDFEACYAFDAAGQALPGHKRRAHAAAVSG
jgi:multiple sugar transport system ATP-binding protein